MTSTKHDRKVDFNRHSRQSTRSYRASLHLDRASCSFHHFLVLRSLFQRISFCWCSMRHKFHQASGGTAPARRPNSNLTSIFDHFFPLSLNMFPFYLTRYTKARGHPLAPDCRQTVWRRSQNVANRQQFPSCKVTLGSNSALKHNFWAEKVIWDDPTLKLFYISRIWPVSRHSHSKILLCRNNLRAVVGQN